MDAASLADGRLFPHAQMTLVQAVYSVLAKSRTAAYDSLGHSPEPLARFYSTHL